jgi:phosphatidylethanolamine/phosphatidyl-N-methylethanolamine N-methyltransferase
MFNETELSKLVNEYYKNYYSKIHRGVSNSYFSYHKALEKFIDLNQMYPVTLELGAGDLTHLIFVRHKYQIYIASDIRTIHSEIHQYIDPGSIPNISGVYTTNADATKLEYADNSIDRIVSGCLLLHLDNPFHALDEWLRVLKPGGIISTLIPNDQSIIIELYRKLISRRKARNLGFFEFDLINAIEHKNYHWRIVKLVSRIFSNHQPKFSHFPNILGKNNLFCAYSVLTLTKKFD